MRSEDEAGLNLKILVEFVDNASGQMELKLTGGYISRSETAAEC